MFNVEGGGGVLNQMNVADAYEKLVEASIGFDKAVRKNTRGEEKRVIQGQFECAVDISELHALGSLLILVNKKQGGLF